MAAKRPIPIVGQKQKTHHCPICGEAAKLFKAIPGGSIRGRCAKGHTHAKAQLVLR